MNIDFATLSEHTVRAAIDYEGEDNPIVEEVTRLMQGYAKRIETCRDYDEDAAQVLTPTATTSPIELVAMELLAQMLMDEEE